MATNPRKRTATEAGIEPNVTVKKAKVENDEPSDNAQLTKSPQSDQHLSSNNWSGGSFESFGSFKESNHNGSSFKESNTNEFSFQFASSSEFTFESITAANTNKSKKKEQKEKDLDDAQTMDKPVAELKGKIDSGDGVDKVIFSLKTQVYELVSTKYQEKGFGTLEIRQTTSDDIIKSRMLCRTDVTFKNLINAMIYKDTKFEKLPPTTVRCTVFEQVVNDDAKDEDHTTMNVAKTYLLRSKSIDTFLAKIEEIQGKML
eukprot:162379_1